MKNILLVVLILLISTCVSYSVPLNGTYIVGPTGDYPTPNAASIAISTNGISGPVTMRIQPGVYNEHLVFNHVFGTSYANRITFESFNLDTGSVKINASPYSVTFDLESKNIILKNLSLGNVSFDANTLTDISLIDNNLNNSAIRLVFGTPVDCRIMGNANVGAVRMFGISFIGTNLVIADNIFTAGSGHIDLASFNGVRVANNKLASLKIYLCNNVNVEKNMIKAVSDTMYAVNIESCGGVNFTNNIVSSYSPSFETVFSFNNDNIILYNSFISEGAGDTTVSIFNQRQTIFKNNIVKNSNNGIAMFFNTVHLTKSDYNNFFNGGNGAKLIKYKAPFTGDTASFSTLESFTSALGLDSHSVSYDPAFMSYDDLHLMMSESGNEILACVPPDTLIPDDIDGQIRSAAFPYMGADELEGVLPVELASFSSIVNGNNVELLWSTYSETNNYGFEIHRAALNGSEDWAYTGFVSGNGNVNAISNYNFADIDLSEGKYIYRLKQIDFNGSFKYYYLANEVIVGVPSKYRLSQNYPNPFNPVTKINYEIPVNGNVSLKIFDITGKEVRSLVNEFQNAGFYTVQFSANVLASGQYLYEIKSGDFSEVKRMVLIK